MKRLFAMSLVAMLASSFLVVSTAAASTLSFDSERSTINWVSEAPSEKITGTASEVSGEVEWDLENLEGITGRILFPVNTMQSGNSLRDRHLQGWDWLRADENPTIVFELEGLEEIEQRAEDNQIRVEAIAVGRLTVNGVTVESRTPVTMAILPETKRVRIQTDLEVRLRDHEVQGRRGAIGNEVAEVIEIEGVFYGSWQ